MEWNKLAAKVGLPEHIEFPKIDPVPEGIDRPFWSVMIPTYNRTDLLAETLRSVLEQEPGLNEMQIEVVDDCSTEGDAEAIVKEIGKGRVSFYRQPQNVGQALNCNTCINRAKGYWVHILHDDDKVLPGFYSRLQTDLEKQDTVGASMCRHIYMDESGQWQYFSFLEMPNSGILTNWLQRLKPGVIQFPAVVVRRSSYEKVGGFYPELKYMVDLEMWMRIARNYQFWYECQPLACYRSQNLQSVTSSVFKSRIIIADGYRLLAVLNSYISEKKDDHLIREAQKGIIIFLILVIRENFKNGNINAAFNQVQEILKYDWSFGVIKGIVGSFKLIIKSGISNLTSVFQKVERKINT